METTSPSLLERLRRPDDQQAWEQFTRLYTPLLLDWARGRGLQEHDAADLVQDVLTTLIQQLPSFTYDPEKSFRGWLRTILLNKWRNRCRIPPARHLDRYAIETRVAESDDAKLFAEAEYRQHLVRRILELIQTDFQPKTWRAFWECQVAGRAATEVAAELGMSISAVYVAKCRVLNRLREELRGLLD